MVDVEENGEGTEVHSGINPFYADMFTILYHVSPDTVIQLKSFVNYSLPGKISKGIDDTVNALGNAVGDKIIEEIKLVGRSV